MVQKMVQNKNAEFTNPLKSRHSEDIIDFLDKYMKYSRPIFIYLYISL